MLSNTDRGIGRERETRQTQPIEISLYQAAGREQALQRARNEPMRPVGRMTNVRNRNRYRNDSIVVSLTPARHDVTAVRLFMERRSTHAPVSSSARPNSLSCALWIFSVGVSGSPGSSYRGVGPK